MILMTGGAFQGALECAKMIEKEKKETIRIVDGRNCGPEEAKAAEIFDHMTDWMRREMEQGTDTDQIREQMDRLIEENPGICIITRELGCGLVPIDRFDRAYREAHGRLCCHLAEQAEQVYRVSCGLAQCIKGES